MSHPIDDGLPAPFIDSDSNSDSDNVQIAPVDPDDYAETAAGDLPSDVNSRTYQSEEAFLREKAGYTAKIDDGDSLGALLKAVPCLTVGELALHSMVGGVNGLSLNSEAGEERMEEDEEGGNDDGHDVSQDVKSNGDEAGPSPSKYKLTKRDVQLLGYAAGELYFLREWSKLSILCRAVEHQCQVDAKLRANLIKWNGKAVRRMRSSGKGVPGPGTPVGCRRAELGRFDEDVREINRLVQNRVPPELRGTSSPEQQQG
jgi:hypothetical protein